jgi:hypothetical protein
VAVARRFCLVTGARRSRALPVRSGKNAQARRGGEPAPPVLPHQSLFRFSVPHSGHVTAALSGPVPRSARRVTTHCGASRPSPPRDSGWAIRRDFDRALDLDSSREVEKAKWGATSKPATPPLSVPERISRWDQPLALHAIAPPRRPSRLAARRRPVRLHQRGRAQMHGTRVPGVPPHRAYARADPRRSKTFSLRCRRHNQSRRSSSRQAPPARFRSEGEPSEPVPAENRRRA